MESQSRVVFQLSDVPLVQSPNGETRNSVIVTDETCGSKQYMAGFFFIQPGAKGHSGSHKGQEELYYIISGQGQIVIDDVATEIGPGHVVFIPDGATHHLVNSGAETMALFWVMPQLEGSAAQLKQALASWPRVEPDSPWE